MNSADNRGKGDYQIDYVPAPRITEADKTNDRKYAVFLFIYLFRIDRLKVSLSMPSSPLRENNNAVQVLLFLFMLYNFHCCEESLVGF